MTGLQLLVFTVVAFAVIALLLLLIGIWLHLFWQWVRQDPGGDDDATITLLHYHGDQEAPR